MKTETPVLQRDRLLVTCEHAGNRVPRECRALFCGHESLLASHRGYDVGALALARDFARAFRAELIYSRTSRLVVDLNRSRSNPSVFSEATRLLDREARRALLERHWLPYREAVEARIAGAAERGRRAVHLSCHSFTPALNGAMRRGDIGLLFDPRRQEEAQVCAAWQRALRSREPRLLVRRNYPYRGVADGVMRQLRRRFPPRQYVGVELEVSQKYPLGEPSAWRALRRALVDTFSEALVPLER